MRYFVLACDYDGTIATHGKVPPSTVAALKQVRESGRKLILVTGRQLDDLREVCPHIDLFDSVVAENGALLYDPRKGEERLLAEPAADEFVDELRKRAVAPLSVGKSIVATWQPHERAVMEAVHACGLELQVIFNKGAIMILPSGVNKNSGLRIALRELGLSPHNVVGVGDAENDHAFLTLCEFSVAVANALDSLKERCDLVTRSDHGSGVEELIRDLMSDDLSRHEPRRHALPLGRDENGREITIPPYGSRLLIAGPSGSGKSTVVTALLERLAQAEYQFCILDPEGDYEHLDNAVTIGDEDQAPATEEVLQLLGKFENVAVDLLGVPVADRPAFGAKLLRRVVEMNSRSGRPHWLVLDEAHHMLPRAPHPVMDAAPGRFGSDVLVTVHPQNVSSAALGAVNVVIAVGAAPEQTLADFGAAVGRAPPQLTVGELANTEVLVWFCRQARLPLRLRIQPAAAERRRHRRKYAEGDLLDRSFFFRGPEGKLNLRAQNLNLFVLMAEGVDNETWLYHLRRGDYSRWVRNCIKDQVLAERLEHIEQAPLPPTESRAQIKAAVEDLYTSPA